MDVTENDLNVQRTLGRLEGKLDTALNFGYDHDARLKSLEGSRAKLSGAMLVLGALGSVLWNLITTGSWRAH